MKMGVCAPVHAAVRLFANTVRVFALFGRALGGWVGREPDPYSWVAACEQGTPPLAGAGLVVGGCVKPRVLGTLLLRRLTRRPRDAAGWSRSAWGLAR